MKIKVGLIGLGKMGISHLAIVNAHPLVELVGVCDASQYLLDFTAGQAGHRCFKDYRQLIDEAKPQAVFVATPSKTHAEIVQYALERGIHVFCEKPFVLDLADGERLAAMAESKGLVTQVGYHYRFVAAFEEARRVVHSGALGTVHHVRAEAYGPVVLRPKGGTWRAVKNEGGGCLYDYACHALDLVSYIQGAPAGVSGVVMNKVFSADVDDEVYAQLHFEGGATGQLAANWSDESFRKMSTKISVWGTNGRVTADRQECQIYLREPHPGLPDTPKGWTVRYTTDLTKEVWYYLRGEEYSAQADHFFRTIAEGGRQTRSSFREAMATDRVVAMILAQAGGHGAVAQAPRADAAAPVSRGWLARLFG